MRKYLIYLVMTMFVGVHVISDLTPQVHGEIDRIQAASINFYNQPAKFGTSLDFVAAQVSYLPDVGNCCSKPKNFRADIDLHCIADCGLASIEFTAYRPSPRLYLALPNDPSAINNSISDLFRPPIV